jgi:hypothetical protein
VSAIETEYRSVLNGIDASYADFAQATRTHADNLVDVDRSFTYRG